MPEAKEAKTARCEALWRGLLLRYWVATRAAELSLVRLSLQGRLTTDVQQKKGVTELTPQQLRCPHLQSVTQSNQWYVGTKCTRCGTRLSYTPTEAAKKTKAYQKRLAKARAVPNLARTAYGASSSGLEWTHVQQASMGAAPLSEEEIPNVQNVSRAAPLAQESTLAQQIVLGITQSLTPALEAIFQTGRSQEAATREGMGVMQNMLQTQSHHSQQMQQVVYAHLIQGAVPGSPEALNFQGAPRSLQEPPAIPLSSGSATPMSHGQDDQDPQDFANSQFQDT